MGALTKYRIYRYNNVEYVQYEKIYKFLFFKWKKWEFIKFPNLPDNNLPHVISSKIPHFNVKKFATWYPTIDDYYNSDLYKDQLEWVKSKKK